MAQVYTTYLNVPRTVTKEGQLLVKCKGEPWKLRWVSLKGPGLSAFKLLQSGRLDPVSAPFRGPLKLSIDLGKADCALCAAPDKFGGLHVVGVKPGKGISRCYLQCSDARAAEEWRAAIADCMRTAQAAVGVTLTIPQSIRPGQALAVRFRDGQIRRVNVPAGIRAGRQLNVRIFQPPAAHAVAAGPAAAPQEGAGGARFQAALARVCEVAACSREEAAAALLEARMDAGLAITSLIAADRQPAPEAAVEDGGGGGSSRTGERALEEEGLRRLASGDDASAEFIAQQQAMLDRLERQRSTSLGGGEPMETEAGAAGGLPEGPLEVVAVEAVDALAEEEQVGLFVRRQGGTDTAIRASASDTVGQLKERVSAVDSIAIPVAEQRLLFGGAELDEESAVLADLGVGNGGVVYLVRRLEVPT